MNLATSLQLQPADDSYTISYRTYDNAVAALKDSTCIALWSHLKLICAHGNHYVRLHGRIRFIPVKSLITTEAKLTESLGVTRRQIRRGMESLSRLGLIRFERSRKLGTTITLLTKDIRRKEPPKADNRIIEKDQVVTPHIKPPRTSNERIINNNINSTPSVEPRQKEITKPKQYPKEVVELLAYAQKRLKRIANHGQRFSFLHSALYWQEIHGGSLEGLRGRIDWLAENEERLSKPTTSINRVFYLEQVHEYKHAKTAPQFRQEATMTDDRRPQSPEEWMSYGAWLASGQSGTFMDHFRRVFPGKPEGEILAMVRTAVEGYKTIRELPENPRLGYDL